MRKTRRVRRRNCARRSRRGGKEEKGGWVGGVFGGGRRSRRGGVEESADDPDGSNWVTMGADTGGKMAKRVRSRRGGTEIASSVHGPPYAPEIKRLSLVGRDMDGGGPGDIKWTPEGGASFDDSAMGAMGSDPVGKDGWVNGVFGGGRSGRGGIKKGGKGVRSRRGGKETADWTIMGLDWSQSPVMSLLLPQDH